MFFEKINKITSPHQEKKREDPKNKIRNERGEITNTEIQRIVKKCHKELYVKKFENLAEMDKFLEKYNSPKLNEQEAESLNRSITAEEIEVVIIKLPTEKKPRT